MSIVMSSTFRDSFSVPASATGEMNAKAKEQVDNMKRELVETQEKVDIVLMKIEQGNDQYYILKKRYDALDIEYAQLYEKFSETEASSSSE